MEVAIMKIKNRNISIVTHRTLSIFAMVVAVITAAPWTEAFAAQLPNAADSNCMQELQNHLGLMQRLVPDVRALNNKSAETAWVNANNEVIRLKTEVQSGRPNACAQLPKIRANIQALQANVKTEQEKISQQVKSVPAPVNELAVGPNGWTARHGWKAKYQTDLTKPVVLLIHGLVSTQQSWTDPREQWNIKKIAYDPKSEPGLQDVHPTHPFHYAWSPGAPGHNFWDALGSELNIATWNQTPCIAAATRIPSNTCLDSDTFEAAYPTAVWALQKLLAETRGPVTIVAHSRGGLIARRLLKEYGDAGGRIRQLITIHSPNSGTSLATKPDNAYANLTAGLEKMIPEKELRNNVAEFTSEIQNGLLNIVGLSGGRELGANMVPKQVAAGEKALPGVSYITFGGTSPTLLRLHIHTYTFTKHPPFFTKTRGSIPFIELKAFNEMTMGKGDTLVTDDSAKLPWLGAQHFSNPLHHGEVLWTASVINHVKNLSEGLGKRAN